MKKVFTISFTTLLFAIFPARGQSSFALRNYYPPDVNAPVFDSQGDRLEGSDYGAELWGSSTPRGTLLSKIALLGQ